MNKKEKLRLVHIPQVGYKAKLIVGVEDLEEAIRMENLLAYYDIMQLECNIKPNYSNITFLEMYYEEEGEWYDYYDDNGRDFDEIKRLNSSIISYLEGTDKGIWTIKKMFKARVEHEKGE